MKKGLNATQLKLIAICAMVIDHIAWGFVDLFSIQGQIMHIIGRLTIPIMCFFIAEGYRKTSNLLKYVERMVLFSVITVIPFTLFFREEYGYRQNFFFDLTLALLALIVSDSKKLKKLSKTLLIILIICISWIIGGWPVFPIMLVMIFYYIKDFKKVCWFVIGAISSVEITIIALIFLNNRLKFAPQYLDWKWYQWLYFFGFILALPLLKMYNGERGKYPIGRYFFFLFYPIHFMVLWSIKSILNGNVYDLYLAMNVLCFALTLALTVRIALSKNSRTQVAAVIMSISACVYIFGFIVEIATTSLDIAYAGTAMEYFGETLVLLSAFWFIADLCHIRITNIYYSIAGLFSAAIIYLVLTTRENKFFYSNMYMDYSGPFHRLVLEYGPGFWVFLFYMFVLCASSFGLILYSYGQSYGIEKKRHIFLLIAIVCPWVPNLIRGLGLTGGYEISAIGIFGSIFCMYISLLRYGYFDSIQLAGVNALSKVDEGIIVVNALNRILYYNEKVRPLVPEINHESKVKDIDIIGKMLSGETKEVFVGDDYYEISVIPLIENGFTQGHMISTRNMTQQYNHLKKIERFAHTDSLTGLYNRAYLKERFDEIQKTPIKGYVMMIDLDNFKKVNDANGHGVGDTVLLVLAKTLLSFSDENNLFCRIGGDEFCAFIANVVTSGEIKKIGQQMIDTFAEYLKEEGFENLTSISIGTAFYDGVLNNGEMPNEKLSAVYRLADVALYESKRGGKGVCNVYETE